MRLAILLTSALALLPSAAAAGDVQVQIRNGRVWISATNASVGQILAAWARVGRTTIVNAEKVASPPVTLEVNDMPERDALDLVLRSASGYVAIARASVEADLSTFDRILIMATSTPVTAPPGRASVPPPVFVPPDPDVPEPVEASTSVQRLIGPDGQPMPDDQDGAPPAVQRAPLGYSSGDAPPAAPGSAPLSPGPGRPTMPAGVSVPGMIVPPPVAAAPQTPQG